MLFLLKYRNKSFPNNLFFDTFLVGSLLYFLIPTHVSYYIRRRSQDAQKVPLIVPCTLPVIGHALSPAWNPVNALASTTRSLGLRTIHGLKVSGYNIHFIYGPKNVARLRKYPTSITTPDVTTFVLKTLFGMSLKACEMYTVDDSGILATPHRGSNAAPPNRIDDLKHASFHKHLLAEGLPKLYDDFATSRVKRLPALGITNEWQEFPDLLGFWFPTMLNAMNETLAGPILESVNPDFTRDLINYYPYLHSMMKGAPRWWRPEAYRLREDLIQTVKLWHAIARARFQEADINLVTRSDPWWGSGFIRERQEMMRKMENWDADALASSDFGVLWGANVNIHPMAIWNVLHVFASASLLLRVRAELATISFNGMISSVDINALMALPLLQSIYAELLRLRVEVQTIFSSAHGELSVNEWRIPKRSLVVVPAGLAHRDPEIWNTRDGEKPLHDFWADRFLLYPDDPLSGPRKPACYVTDSYTSRKKVKREDEIYPAPGSPKPKFVTYGLADSYMPYGVGERSCPGKGFAKREIIAFTAMVVTSFDIEILGGKEIFQQTENFFGIGTQRMKSNIKFRIRGRDGVASW